MDMALRLSLVKFRALSSLKVNLGKLFLKYGPSTAIAWTLNYQSLELSLRSNGLNFRTFRALDSLEVKLCQARHQHGSNKVSPA